MAELCRDFGISRKTGYKHLARYRRDGPEGLRDHSRAPQSHPNQTPALIEASILRVRKAQPTWGSKKILASLCRNGWLEEDLPARSTVDAILKRAGVVQPRKRRTRRPHHGAPVVEAHAPNDCWSIDYKGWFRVGDGTRCDPLTVNDVRSRASLECRALVSPNILSGAHGSAPARRTRNSATGMVRAKFLGTCSVARWAASGGGAARPRAVTTVSPS